MAAPRSLPPGLRCCILLPPGVQTPVSGSPQPPAFAAIAAAAHCQFARSVRCLVIQVQNTGIAAGFRQHFSQLCAKAPLAKHKGRVEQFHCDTPFPSCLMAVFSGMVIIAQKSLSKKSYFTPFFSINFDKKPYLILNTIGSAPKKVLALAFLRCTLYTLITEIFRTGVLCVILYTARRGIQPYIKGWRATLCITRIFSDHSRSVCAAVFFMRCIISIIALYKRSVPVYTALLFFEGGSVTCRTVKRLPSSWVLTVTGRL